MLVLIPLPIIPLLFLILLLLLILQGVHAHADYEWIRILGRSTTTIPNIDVYNGDSISDDGRSRDASTVVIALQGDPVDCDELYGMLERVDLRHRTTFGTGMGVKALAYFGSKVISSNLRKRQMGANCFMGGMDKGKAVLYYLDSVGAVQEVQYGSLGKEMPLILSLLDRKNMAAQKGTSYAID